MRRTKHQEQRQNGQSGVRDEHRGDRNVKRGVVLIESETANRLS